MGSTFKNGLLLEIAAQLLILVEPDDFREFSSLLLSYYDHFQIEEFDKAVSTNVILHGYLTNLLFWCWFLLHVNFPRRVPFLTARQITVFAGV